MMYLEHILFLVVALCVVYFLLKISSAIFIKIIATVVLASVFFSFIFVTCDGVVTIDKMFDFYKSRIIIPMGDLISRYISLEYIKDLDFSNIKDFLYKKSN